LYGDYTGLSTHARLALPCCGPASTSSRAISGFDALHLAAAQVRACDVLAAADARLCAAAIRQGLAVVDLDREEGYGGRLVGAGFARSLGVNETQTLGE
jgi:hypothetical protein